MSSAQDRKQQQQQQQQQHQGGGELELERARTLPETTVTIHDLDDRFPTSGTLFRTASAGDALGDSTERKAPHSSVDFYRSTRHDHIQRAALRAVQFEEGAKRASALGRRLSLSALNVSQEAASVVISAPNTPAFASSTHLQAPKTPQATAVSTFRSPIYKPMTPVRDLRPSKAITVSASSPRVSSMMTIFGAEPSDMEDTHIARSMSSMDFSLDGPALRTIQSELKDQASSHDTLPTLSTHSEMSPLALQPSQRQPEVHKIEIAAEDATPEPAPLGESEDIDPEILGTPVQQGLNAKQVQERLLKYGYNELAERKPNPLRKFVGYFLGPISYLIEASAVLAAVVGDWASFGIIFALLFINAFIGFIEESKAESAIDALKNTLALQSHVIRDGTMIEVPAREVVPGDIISLRLGDLIPADAKLLGLNNTFEATQAPLAIDESGLTGESLPVEKSKGEIVWSGCIVKQGVMLALVTKTGSNTFVGRAAHLIATTDEQGHFQKVVQQIGNLLIAITLSAVILIVIVKSAQGKHYDLILELILSITIAAIPVGLPTVMSVTMAVGANQMAKHQCIVRRLAAVEELAGIEILCSDKTGTLTLNQLTLDDPFLQPGVTNEDLLLTAFLASEPGTSDAIETCVRNAAIKSVPALKHMQSPNDPIPGFRIVEFHPFDPISKLTRAIVQNTQTNPPQVMCVAKGAPQVILRLCNNEDPVVAEAIKTMAKRGFRALGVARAFPSSSDPKEAIKWELVGLLSLLDPPRPDSASTIAACKRYGISVKMITGDAPLIAKEVSKRLGLFQNILTPATLHSFGEREKAAIHCCLKADGFAQVIPEDKFRIVELLQRAELGKLIGMTGDGVNDAPALKKANVGIAVHGCTDAARAAADIVLLEPGLSPIVHGVVTARQIFQRMRSYTVYRISATVYFVIFLFVTSIVYDYTLPPTNVVLIALLNDAATIAISTDNTIVSQKPDRWRLGEIMVLAFVLGSLLAGAAFAFFFVARESYHMTNRDLDSIMYLVLSVSADVIIFSTRLAVPLYSNMPSASLTFAIVAAQVVAFFLAVYGELGSAIGYAWGLSIVAICLGWTIIIDQVKCYIYRKWSYELTAKLWPVKSRRDEWQRRLALRAFKARVKLAVAKVRRVQKMIYAAYLWRIKVIPVMQAPEQYMFEPHELAHHRNSIKEMYLPQMPAEGNHQS